MKGSEHREDLGQMGIDVQKREQHNTLGNNLLTGINLSPRIVNPSTGLLLTESNSLTRIGSISSGNPLTISADDYK